MGFPNHPGVAAFLNKHHAGKYMVFNFSERAYDYGPFGHQVNIYIIISICMYISVYMYI